MKVIVSEKFEINKARIQFDLIKNGQSKNYFLFVLNIGDDSNGDSQFKAIDAICPHSSGPLYEGDIEDIQSCKDSVIICPYHEYDFSISSGKSLSDMHPYSVNVYNCKVVFELDQCVIDIDLDTDGPYQIQNLQVTSSSGSALDNHILQLDGLPHTPADPKCLIHLAILILNTADPSLKVQRVQKMANLWNNRQIPLYTEDDAFNLTIPQFPPRKYQDKSMQINDAADAPRRGKGGTLDSRIAILHSLANIEQWAIDLAVDMIARFGNRNVLGSDDDISQTNISYLLPEEFYDDFVRVAVEESKHFSLLSERLESLGSYYGKLPIHASLWQTAIDTKDCIFARLAIVHLVHESRGLDVNPGTIAKFKRNYKPTKSGDNDNDISKPGPDMESVQVLELIHSEEVGHVAVGKRWFSFLCESVYKHYKQGKQILICAPEYPYQHDLELLQDEKNYFQQLVRRHFVGNLKPPFNRSDRQKAGLNEDWYLELSDKN